MAKAKTSQATSGSKSLPSLKENVRAGIKEDVERIKKTKTTKAKGAAKTAVTEAAKRAGKRMLGRAGAVGAAATAGFAIGTAINKATGLSSKIANALSPSRSANPNVDVTGKSTRILMSKKAPKASMEKKEKPSSATKPTPQPTPTRKKFSAAFGAARKAKQKSFTFQDKKFSTKVK